MKIDGLTLIRWGSLAFAAAGPIITMFLLTTSEPLWALAPGLGSLFTVPLGMMSYVFAIPGSSQGNIGKK